MSHWPAGRSLYRKHRPMRGLGVLLAIALGSAAAALVLAWAEVDNVFAPVALDEVRT